MLASLIFILALVYFSLPKLQNYNSQFEDKKNISKIKSDGVINFSNDYIRESSPIFYAEILLLFSLFLSLLLTKRIIFSFLFAFLFIIQFIIFLQLFDSAVQFPRSYFVNYQSFSLIFTLCVLALAVWQSSLICRFYRRRLQTKTTLK